HWPHFAPPRRLRRGVDGAGAPPAKPAAPLGRPRPNRRTRRPRPRPPTPSTPPARPPARPRPAPPTKEGDLNFAIDTLLDVYLARAGQWPLPPCLRGPGRPQAGVPLVEVLRDLPHVDRPSQLVSGRRKTS